MHVLRGEKLWQIGVPGYQENREIAAVDNPQMAAARFEHETTEIVIHLRRATREVDDGDCWTEVEQCDEPIDDALGHDLCAQRSGLDVAVMAGQVAESPHIDLQGRDRLTRERRQ